MTLTLSFVRIATVPAASSTMNMMDSNMQNYNEKHIHKHKDDFVKCILREERTQGRGIVDSIDSQSSRYQVVSLFLDEWLSTDR